jgi:protein transport protein SEC23
VILLLDTFFYIAVWKGETIAQWEDAKYHEDPNYENLKVLLEQPIEDAKYIMSERFPMPRFFVTKPGESNERKIKVRVNPSSLTANNATVESGNFFTEDVSLSVFMQHLIKMAV